MLDEGALRGSLLTTKWQVYSICERLTFKELQRFAQQLNLVEQLPVDTLREKVMDAVWNYSGRKPDTSTKLKQSLEKGGNLKNAHRVVWSKCDSLGWDELTKAEHIFLTAILVAEEVSKKRVSFEAMLFLPPDKAPADWPMPVLKTLKLIGAMESAALIQSAIQASGL